MYTQQRLICSNIHTQKRLLQTYKLPPAAPTIFNPPAPPLPGPSLVVEYANQYRDGCHATAGIPTLLPPPTGTVYTLSPDSAWKISRPLPPQPASSHAPQRNRPSKLQLTPRTAPPLLLDTVRRQIQSVVSQREMRASLPPTAR